MMPNNSQFTSVPPGQNKRRAHFRPHVLLGAAVSCLLTGAFVTLAATGGKFSFVSPKNQPVPMKSAAKTHSATNAVKAEKSGARAQVLGSGASSNGKFRLTQAGGGAIIRPMANIGDGRSGFNLSEVDLTPNTASDERDPAFSPNSEYIAFRSNGVDANNDRVLDASGLSSDGKYHIWVGRFQQVNGAPQLRVYQITGTATTQSLRNYDQSRPSWSPNGRELVFASNSANGQQIFRVSLTFSNGIPSTSSLTQITSGSGEKQAPAWSPDGTEIAYMRRPSGGRWNIHRVSPLGATLIPDQVTGTGEDSDSGGGSDNKNPAYSLVQPNVIYFSSNRGGAQGTRIWAIRTSGTRATQITDPTRRANGSASDNDDYPTLSESGVSNSFFGVGLSSGEVLSFQSNSLVDGSDTTRDRNIWVRNVDSMIIGRGAETDFDTPLFYIGKFGQADNVNGDELVYSVPPQGTDPARLFNLESGRITAQNPEGVAFYRGFDKDYVFMANRNLNRIDRFDAETGEAAPSSFAISTGTGQFTPSNTQTVTNSAVPAPSGIAVYQDLFNSYLLTVSGNDSTVAVRRYSAETGAPAGRAGGTDSAFTFGEPGTNPLGTQGNVNNEGIVVSPDQTRLYVSNFSQDRINVYSLVSFTDNSQNPARSYSAGQWIGEIKTSGFPAISDPMSPNPQSPVPFALDGPTGLAFGPDINGDGEDDLYVSSSVSHDVFAFEINSSQTVQNTAQQGLATGFQVAVYDNSSGQHTNLKSPEGIRFDKDGVMYVASYGGTSINRYVLEQTPDMDIDFFNPSGIDGQANRADWLVFPNLNEQFFSLTGPSYFDFNRNFSVGYGQDDSNNSPLDLVESSGEARVITNILSSPNKLAESELSGAGVVEDRSADVEPSYGRGGSSVSLQTRVQLAFASNRRNAPNTSNELVNPSGANDNFAVSLGGTSDIWVTAAFDVEAPIIEPGANGYPMLSPAHNSQVFSSNPDIGPRTYAGGLRPGGEVKLALTLRERGSGIGRVSFAFYNADSSSRFITRTRNPINGDLRGITQSESVSAWSAVSGFDFDSPGMSIESDDPSTGTLSDAGSSRERQPNAVAGDGIYYAAKTIRAPNTPGDYYIGVRVQDRSSGSLVFGNYSTYKFIWGFSTLPFTPSTERDLFVSDQTAGQSVSVVARGNGTGLLQEPVESHYLTNWSEANIVGATSGSILVNGVIVARSIPTTFDNVDVWRVLARGPLNEDLLRTNYNPPLVYHIDPADQTKQFRARSKAFADVQRVVLWAAPNVGVREVQFEIPGSIKDGAVQEQLRAYLQSGGRLFLSGRNVLTALGEGANGTNAFRNEELYAAPAGKTFSGEATAVLPATGNNAFAELVYDQIPPGRRAQFSNLQFPRIVPENADAPEFRDGSFSHDLRFGNLMDTIQPVTAGQGVQIFPSYTVGSGNSARPIGQNIIKQRGNGSGIESRVVLFSFDFDAINRRFERFPDPVGIQPLNVRRDVADGIRIWFKTGGIRGQVVDQTGVPVADFLLVVTSGAGDNQRVYAVRTDENGNYELRGLPAGVGYTVSPVLPGRVVGGISGDDLPDSDVNNEFYNGNSSLTLYVEPNTLEDLATIQVDRSGPGAVTGRIVASAQANANPLNRDLHQPVNGLQVMLKLADNQGASDRIRNYVELATTNALGEFAFRDAPSNVRLQLVINPVAGRDTDGRLTGDLAGLDGSRYDETDIRNDPSYARRVIGLGDLRDRKLRRGNVEVVPDGVFVVNDTYTNRPAELNIANYPDAPIDSAADNSNLPVVITRGETISGVFSLRAGASQRVAQGWVVRVVDSNGATIQDASGNALTTTTNAQGRYFLTGIPNGNYKLRGEVPASEVEGFGGLVAERDLSNLSSVAESEKFTFNLQALIATLRGAVRINDQPINGLRVELRDPNTNAVVAFGGIERADTTGETVANAYSIGFVPDGNYKLVVVRSGTDLNGVPDSELTRDITVNAATALVQTENFDIDVPVATSTGRVLLNGTPLQGATIRFVSNGVEVESLRATSGANGVFTAGNRNARIAPGQYTVTASYSADGLALAPVSKNFEVTVSSNGTINLGDFNLQSSALSGSVTFNGGNAAGFTVRLFDANQPNTALRTTTTNSSGQYTFLNMPAGNGSGNGYIVRASRSFGSINAQGETQVSTINSTGVTQASTINISLAGLSGRVTINGSDPAVGARIDVLRGSRNPQGNTTTDSNGNYFITVSADGSYTVQASYSEAGRPLKPVKKSFRVKNGAYSPSVVNLDLRATRLVGRVLANGTPVEGARVLLLDKKGKALRDQFTAITNSEGRYVLSGVKSGTYRVQATLEGVSAFVEAKVSNLRTSGAPDINLVRQELRATTVLRIGSNVRALGGATLDILNTSGNLVGSNFSKVTDSNGNATFFGLTPGNYRARVSLRNLVSETAFSMGSGSDSETFELVVPSGQGLVVLSDTQGLRTTEAGGIDILGVSLLVKPNSNVTVNLTSSNANEVQLLVGGNSNNSQSLTFTPENWNRVQSVTLVGQADSNPDPATNFTINGTSSSSDDLFDGTFSATGTNFEVASASITGPTFPANSRNLVSTPFGDFNGNITVGEAFGEGNYTLYRFNSAGQRNLFLSSGAFPGSDWIAMSRSENMVRGYGYLLATGNNEITMQIPAQSTLFSGDSYEVELTRNPNFEAQTGGSNLQNGYNIIGFPFDPNLYGGADFFQVQVEADGVFYNSLAEAVGAGKLTYRIFTNDPLGRPRELSAADSTMRPFGGYFVRIATDNVKLIIRAQPRNGVAGGGSAGGSGGATSVRRF